jgi:hypothetical protein
MELVYPYYLYRYVREWWNMYSFSIQNIQQFDAAFAGESEVSRVLSPAERKREDPVNSS